MAIYYLHRAESYENLGFSEIAKKDYDIFRELEPNFQYNLEI